MKIPLRGRKNRGKPNGLAATVECWIAYGEMMYRLSAECCCSLAVAMMRYLPYVPTAHIVPVAHIMSPKGSIIGEANIIRQS